MPKPKCALVALRAALHHIPIFPAALCSLMLLTSCGGGEKRQVEIELLDWPDAVMEVFESPGFRMGEPGHEVYLGRGWDVIEQDEHGRFFRWAIGDTVEIRIPVVEPQDLVCRLRWLSAPLGENEMQGVAFLLNGREIERVSMRSRRLSWQELLLPAHGLRRGWNTLEMVPSTRARMDGDDRPLRFYVMEAEWERVQLPTAASEETRSAMKQWVESTKRAGNYVVTAENLVQFSVAVPKGSTLKARFYSGGDQETAEDVTVTIIGQTVEGGEEIVHRGVVRAGTTPTLIQEDIQHDLSGLVIEADPVIVGHGVAIGSLSVVTERSATLRPTVVLITVDGLRYDAVNPEGTTVSRLPFFSWVLQNAFFLRNAFTPSNMTLPIYSSLMTGSYPFMHGVIDDEHGLSSSAGVMAEDLAAEGYRCIGIVGTSLFGPERGRLGRGFHRFSYPDQEHVGAGAQASRIVQVLLSEWPHLSPGFLWLHFDDLAVPSSVPGRYVGRIRPGGYDVGDDVFPVVQQYYGALGYVDSALGAVRTLTAATGLLPETAWLVAGTYGVCLGERGALLLHDELYQETIHVPVIARIPGFSESGRSVVTTISLVDVRSTVCDLTGSLIPPDTHGMSLLPVLRGAEQPRTVFCEAEGRVAAIRWPFKLMHVSNVAGLSSDLPTASVLFNLANDPNETTDCSDQYFSEATDLVSAWINVVSNTIPRYRSVPFRTQ